MMAMLALFEANLKLIPRNRQYGIEKKVSEGQFDEFTLNSSEITSLLEYSLGYIVKTTLKYVFVLNSE
jgi:hypothetical protein